MSEFINKYKNKMKGVKAKTNVKEERKAVTKALHQTLKMAMEGQIAGLIHNGKKFIMLSEENLNSLIQNGGQLIVTEEQKEFRINHQILLNLMSNMNVEHDDENDLFTELDSFTFDFSQSMNGLKSDRENVMNRFMKLVNENEKLVELYKVIEPQVRQHFGGQSKQQEPENNGKLT